MTLHVILHVDSITSKSEQCFNMVMQGLCDIYTMLNNGNVTFYYWYLFVGLYLRHSADCELKSCSSHDFPWYIWQPVTFFLIIIIVDKHVWKKMEDFLQVKIFSENMS